MKILKHQFHVEEIDKTTPDDKSNQRTHCRNHELERD